MEECARNGKVRFYSFIRIKLISKKFFATDFLILYTNLLVSFIIFVAESNCKMNKEKFLFYFKKKEKTVEDNEDIAITNVVTFVTKGMLNWVLLPF